MKTKVIIAEGIVGKAVDFSVSDIIVLNSRISVLEKLLDDYNSNNVKHPRDMIYVNKDMIKDVVVLLSKITDKGISLEQSEIDLFGDTKEITE